jgi:hypothetical protein
MKGRWKHVQGERMDAQFARGRNVIDKATKSQPEVDNEETKEANQSLQPDDDQNKELK